MTVPEQRRIVTPQEAAGLAKHVTTEKVRVCLHPTWVSKGLYPRTYLKCSTCPAVMPICHECGQTLDVDPNGDEW